MSQRRVDPTLITQAPKSLEALLQLLVEGLGWPLPDHLDTLPTLEWSPEELHLDPANLGRLSSIQQVPKLQADQPFGVFVLTFSGGRLPIGALRKLVSQLVTKQRARHRGHPQWDLGDLVFFCHNDDGPGSVHVVALREEEGKQRIKTISWTGDPTPTRLQLLSQHALLDLSWPGSNDIAINEWRDRWRSAFTVGYREGVRSAEALSQRMAEVAAEVRDELRNLLEVETADGPLHALLNDFRERLMATIDEAAFADMFAQTLVYGLLSARVSNPEKFEASESRALLDFENPLLETLYARFNDTADDSLDLDHLGLTDLAHTLAATDIDALLSDFGAQDRRDDPVIYLYEEFLNRYDPKQRRELGTYYTPIPVVAAMVHLVDDLIKQNFGLPGGVSDATTWVEWASAGRDRNLPEGVDPEGRVVTLLDPATGTGTFLLEWIRTVKSRDPGGVLATLDSVAALELSMASYAVAHLKAGLEVPPDLRSSHRLPIYLGDTLAGARPPHITGTEDPIALETELLDQTKFMSTHTVVLGNPPYLRTDSETASSGSLGGIVRFDEYGAPGLIQDFTIPLRDLGAGLHAKNLYNLYVYFWRWAMWHTCEQRSGPAIVAFITASSYLTGQGFAGMRHHMRTTFDDIYVIDLGGEGRGARKEDNVFEGVITPVAIGIGVRNDKPNPDSPAHVHYLRIQGTREDKFEQLGQARLNSAQWTSFHPPSTDPFVPPSQGSYSSWPALTDLFPWQHSGAKAGRTWVISRSEASLRERWLALVSEADPLARLEMFKDSPTGRKISAPLGNSLMPGDFETQALSLADAASGGPILKRFAFRSFDRSWVIADPRVLDRPGYGWAIWSDRQIYMTSVLTGQIGNGPAAIATASVPDLHHFNGRGAKDVVPLYRDAYGTPNADPALLRSVTQAFRSDSSSLPQVTVEDLFAYCYGVLAGSDYSTRFAEELATPGPRIPLTSNPELFTAMRDHGAYMVWLHTFGERSLGADLHEWEMTASWKSQPTRLPVDSTDLRYEPDTQTLVVADGRLQPVSPEVWAFEVSGMQVIKKWLSYRTARGAGRAANSASALDHIRPTTWQPDWSTELAEVVSALQHTLDATPTGEDLLERIVVGELIGADALPEPPTHLRKPPDTTGSTDSSTLL